MHFGPIPRLMWFEKIQHNSVFRFLDFDEDQIQNFVQYLTDAAENELILNQGAKLEFLLIPVTTAFNLELQTNSVFQKMGEITAGRTVNLYSYLRNIPVNYGCRAKYAGQYLKVPKQIFDEILNENQIAKSYLFKVTDEPTLLSLAKEWRSAGVSDEVILPMINQLQVETIQPHQLIFQNGQPAERCVFLVDGKFIVHESTHNKKAWLMPLKTWHFFDETLHQKQVTYGLSAPEKSKLLSMGSKELIAIRNQSPEDFEILSNYLSGGAEEPEDDDEDLEADVDNLFKGSIEHKSWRFGFPIVRQNDQMDCAPACLAMLSEFFGRKLSLQFWRSRLSTDREGTSLFDLATTSGKNGFISHCLELDQLEEVDSYLLPFIILRKYHYMVVYKINKSTAIVGDPGIGIREIPLADLQDGLEPVGLFLKPNAEFYAHENSPSPWLHYVKLFKGLEKEFTIAFACSLLGVFFSIVPALISQFALDEVLAQKDLDMLWFVLATCVGVTIVTNLINWA